MTALISLRCAWAQRQTFLRGLRKDRPAFVSEYSTASDLDCVVTRRAINPADSRFLSVLVSMRGETLPTLRRNWPGRYGLSFSDSRIWKVHFPTKIVERTAAVPTDGLVICRAAHRLFLLRRIIAWDRNAHRYVAGCCSMAQLNTAT